MIARVDVLGKPDKNPTPPPSKQRLRLWHDERADRVGMLFEVEDYREERVDAVLTIFRSKDDSRIVGGLLNRFSAIMSHSAVVPLIAGRHEFGLPLLIHLAIVATGPAGCDPRYLEFLSHAGRPIDTYRVPVAGRGSAWVVFTDDGEGGINGKIEFDPAIDPDNKQFTRAQHKLATAWAALKELKVLD